MQCGSWGEVFDLENFDLIIFDFQNEIFVKQIFKFLFLTEILDTKSKQFNLHKIFLVPKSY